jgi:hypothetical protein
MDIRFKDLPADVSVLNPSDQKLKPGTSQTLLMEWMTQNADVPLDESFTMFVKHHEVEVPYLFKVSGTAYSPVSSSPARILFLRGETQKELTIRNNSKSQIGLRGMSSQSGSFRIGPLPLVLPPGGQATLSLTVARSISDKNYQDAVSLVFDQPVEDMASLIIPVVVNYEKPPEKPSRTLPTQKQIQEMLQKAKQPPTRP